MNQKTRHIEWWLAFGIVSLVCSFAAALFDSMQYADGYPVVYSIEIMGLPFFYTYGMVFMAPAILMMLTWILRTGWPESRKNNLRGNTMSQTGTGNEAANEHIKLRVKQVAMEVHGNGNWDISKKDALETIAREAEAQASWE